MDLVTIEIMRELAMMKGARKADGTWTTDSVRDMEKYLLRAARFQQRVEAKLSGSEEESETEEESE